MIEPEFFNYLENDQTILEKILRESCEREFVAFKHNGFGNVWILKEIKKL